MQKFAIAIHGGAGPLIKAKMSDEKETKYKKALNEAITIGHLILSQGGSAVNAVEAAIKYLEDCPLFNAGKGSVFNHEGNIEMDAAIMEGKELQAGAIAGVTSIKNPISLAKEVMTASNHVLLIGKGAEEFAQTRNITQVDEKYFHLEHRMKQLKRAQEIDKTLLDHAEDKKYGTVGAVALDIEGNLVAGTSTGGMTNKKYGRVGDSPIIGAGTYANNKTCAISCTGEGEYFLRTVAAYDVSCLIEYRGLSLQEACETVIHQKLTAISAEGGLIAIDKSGNIQLSFNSSGMYRASKVNHEPTFIGIFK